MQRGTVLIRVYVESRDELVKRQEARAVARRENSRGWWDHKRESIADVLEAILKAPAAAPAVVNNARRRGKVVNKRARP